jgi:hypothetical protein
MSGPAQVRSTDAIEAFQAALARFQERVQGALDTLDAELQRADNWVEHERPAYWKRQTKEADDAVQEAKVALEHCRTFKSMDGERPRCREEEDALRAAKARLEFCREKAEVVKKWQRNFRHESLEYQGRMGQLRRACEHDVPNARAALSKILRRLEEYQVERPPEAMTLASTNAPPASMARAPEPPPADESATTQDPSQPS